MPSLWRFFDYSTYYHGQLPLQSVYASGPYIDTDVDLPGFFPPPPLFWLVEDLRWREVAAPRTRGIR